MRISAMIAAFALSEGVACAVMAAPCRLAAAAADGRLVIIREDGRVGATLAQGDVGKWTAAWSPDGEYVLYSSFPRTHGDPVDVHLARTDGTEMGSLRITATEPRSYDVEGIRQIRWLDDSSFWYEGRVGHQGAYVDVWDIAPRFARSDLRARLGVAGGPCSLSPDTKALACVGEDHLEDEFGINIFDYRTAVSGEPPPEVGTAEDATYVAIASRSGGGDSAARVEGGLYWRNGAQLTFALRRGTRLELGSLERRSADTKGWTLRRRPLVGVDGTVKTIEFRDENLEIGTDQGLFSIGFWALDTAPGKRTGAVLAAVRLSSSEPAAAARLNARVLDRWCSPVGAR